MLATASLEVECHARNLGRPKWQSPRFEEGPWRVNKWIRYFIRPESKKKFKGNLKPHTKRTQGECLTAIIAKINPKLKGWYGYVRHASRDALREIDGWVRGRLRSLLRKRNKRKGRACGADHHRWANSYFAAQGLFCLEQAQRAEIAGLPREQTC